MSKKYHDRIAKTSGTSSKMFESDFGRRILMKYGWEEGKGLGRNNEGRAECIQAIRREEKKGLGAESSADSKKDWENWWADCFNSAAKKMSVSKSTADAGCASSSSSDSEDDGKEAGRVTAVKSAKVMQGKIRRVLRQERPRETCPASPAAGPRLAPSVPKSEPSAKRGLPALDLDDGCPGAKRIRA